MSAFPGRYFTPSDPAVSKMRNKKVEIDGIVFDSQKEGRYYLKLKEQKSAGEILSFDRQITFELIPRQTVTVPTQDKKGREIQKEKILEHACTYKADFVVEHLDGTKDVIDCKGNRALDQKYPIKRKLMLYRFGIRIQEV